MTDRPRLSIAREDTTQIVEAFVEGLQTGHDRRDADTLNHQFAADIVWGSPYGAVVNGYDQLHPIHVRFQQQPWGGPPVHYEVRHVMRVSDDAIVAHIARVVVTPTGEAVAPSHDPSQPFSEMAMYVLVRRNGKWWLAAGQNTPIRPGEAVAAT
jgi:uncharacterized protein (TIGR02246 family)